MWSQLKTLLFLDVLSTFAVGAASYFATGWAMTFVAAAVLLNLGAYFFSDRLVLRVHRARAIGDREHPALHSMNQELAHAAADYSASVQYRIQNRSLSAVVGSTLN